MHGEKEVDSYPYGNLAECLEIDNLPGSLVNFRISSDKILVQGDLQKLSVIADNIIGLAEYGQHIHIDYWEDHLYLSEYSIPIVISFK